MFKATTPKESPLLLPGMNEASALFPPSIAPFVVGGNGRLFDLGLITSAGRVTPKEVTGSHGATIHPAPAAAVKDPVSGKPRVRGLFLLRSGRVREPPHFG